MSTIKVTCAAGEVLSSISHLKFTCEVHKVVENKLLDGKAAERVRGAGTRVLTYTARLERLDEDKMATSRLLDDVIDLSTHEGTLTTEHLGWDTPPSDDS